MNFEAALEKERRNDLRRIRNRSIAESFVAGASLAALAKVFGITKGRVSAIVQRECRLDPVFEIEYQRSFKPSAQHEFWYARALWPKGLAQ